MESDNRFPIFTHRTARALETGALSGAVERAPSAGVRSLLTEGRLSDLAAAAVALDRTEVRCKDAVDAGRDNRDTQIVGKTLAQGGKMLLTTCGR